MPTTSEPASLARYTTDLITEFSPGTSPPPVRIPMRFANMKMLLRRMSSASGSQSSLYRRLSSSRRTLWERPPAAAAVTTGSNGRAEAMPFQSNPGKNLSRDSLSLGLQSRRRLTNYLQESHPVGLEQFGDAFFVDLRDDDLADLGMNIGEDAHALHPLCLKFVVLCRGHIVHRAGIVAVDEEQLGYRHQALLAYRRERVLVANRQDASPATILDVGEDHVGEFLPAGLVQHTQLQKLGAGRVWT